MKIFLNIEADSPAELNAAIDGLHQAIAGVTQVKANVVDKPLDAALASQKAPPYDQQGAVEKKAAKKDKASKEPVAPAVEPTKTEPKALTEEEVRNAIVDHMNDWTEADPKDADIRLKRVLKPLIEKFNSEKLSGMLKDNADKFGEILAWIDESKERLAEFKKERGIE